MTGAILCVDDEDFVLQALYQDLQKYFGEEFLIEFEIAVISSFPNR